MLLLLTPSCKKELSCENCKDHTNTVSNKPPIAVAGPDQAITLPTDSVQLDGNASTDPDGKISAWQWTKVSGPASFRMTNRTVAKTTAKDLVAGIYLFELMVTDNNGLSARDTVQVKVDTPP